MKSSNLIVLLIVGYLSIPACTDTIVETDEAQVSVYNDFSVSYANSADGGIFVLHADNVFYDEISVRKLNENGLPVWDSKIGRNSSQFPIGYCDLNTDSVISAFTTTLDGGLAVISNINLDKSKSKLEVFDQEGKLSISVVIDDVDSNDIHFSGYRIRKIVRTNDGGYSSIRANQSSVQVKKYNKDGLLMWNKRHFVSIYNECPENIGFISTSDNGFVITGSPNKIDQKGFVMKLNAQGEELWRYYNFSQLDVTALISPIENFTGDYVLLAKTGGFGAGNSVDDVFLFTLDAGNGNLLWQNEIVLENADIPKAIIQTADNGYAIVGDKSLYSTNGEISLERSKILLIKTDEVGNIQYSTTYEGNTGSQGNYIRQRSDGTFLVAGNKISYNNTSNLTTIIIKTRSNGEL